MESKWLGTGAWNGNCGNSGCFVGNCGGKRCYEKKRLDLLKGEKLLFLGLCIDSFIKMFYWHGMVGKRLMGR